MRSLIIGTALVAMSCTPSPRRIVINNNTNTTVNTPNGNGTGGNQPVAGTATGAPLQVLNQVDTHLSGRGFQRVGPAVRNANMPAGGIVAYAINATPGQCYVSLAIGAPNTDLNLIILDPQGRQVGYNVQPDGRPWVRVCTQTSGRYIARLQMASGQGEYFYALYQGSVNDPQLTALLGGTAQAAPQDTTVALDPATQQRINQAGERYQRQGFTSVGPAQGVRRGSREGYDRELNLQAGVCYQFASFGGPGAEDTDLYVFNSDDEQMVDDVLTNLDAEVEFCPQASGRYRLRALMYDGNGPIYVAGWQRQQSQVAVNDPNANNPVLGAQQQSQGLDERYSLLDLDMQARGYESYGDISRGELTESGTQDYDIQLEGGKCYAIVAVGANSVRNLDLVLLDSRGRQLDADTAGDARPIVRVCAERSGTFKMQVRMASGSGEFRYHAYRWPRGTRGPFGLNGLIYVRLAEVSALLNVEGYEPDATAAPGRGRLRREGASANHNLELPANHCVGVLVVGGDGVSDLDITLTKSGRNLAADGTRNPFPTVRHCTTEAGRYRLSVSASGGSGEYFYQVFRRDQ
ncbi:MAG: hypothetical protein AAGE52_07095 [Myxococcota bacterium]